MDPKLQIAVVGGSGVVGREMLAALQEQSHPADKITVLGTERSAGTELDYLDETLEIEALTPESFRGIGLVLLAAPGAVAEGLAKSAQAAGAWVVDVSPLHRLRSQVPLVVSGVNEAVLESPFPGRVVAAPGPVTFALVTALEPLRKKFGLKRVQLTALMGASTRGLAGVVELEQQTAALLSGREPEVVLFPHRLGFNVVPQVGEFDGAWTAEEQQWQPEAHKVWGGGELPPIEGTAVQVPTFYGCSLAVTVQLSQSVNAEGVVEALRGHSGLKLLDEPAEKIYPMPLLVTADPAVHVGRVRVLPSAADWVTFFVSVDNAGRGSGLNAVEIGERLTSWKA